MALVLATIPEAASFFDIAPSTINRWAKAKLITVHSIRGKRVLIEDVEKLLNSKKASAGRGRPHGPTNRTK